MVSVKSFPDRSRQLSLQPTQMGSRSSRPQCAWPAASHESHAQRHVSIHYVWRRTAFQPHSSGWVYSTRHMKWKSSSSSASSSSSSSKHLFNDICTLCHVFLGKDFSIGTVPVFCMLLKHCIWLNKQRPSNTKDLPFLASLSSSVQC